MDNDTASIIKGWKQWVVAGLSVRYAAPEVFARLRVSQHPKRISQNTSINALSAAVPHSESAVNSTVEEDKIADVYAFAIVLWELLERKVPWAGLSNEEIEFRVRQGDRPRIEREAFAPEGEMPPTEEEQGHFDEEFGGRHTRNSTMRTAASSIITSFKRFTFQNKPQDDFDADNYSRAGVKEIMEIAWHTEPHIRPAFEDMKNRLTEMLQKIQSNAQL